MKQIHIRAYPEGIGWLRYFVIHESEAAIHIDNRAENPLFRTNVTLVKVGEYLENSAGQKFEIRKEETK